ncbi:flagellar filament capping protein FliD [Radiobacillus deserti]|uniref:Flagellar hook-associated protein 2 n=1 Tax=Radiobacillus deserti TaxID=2594883 RepID=A0A516KIR8_9BACI|nr:flagellar filament capping protein FliD [Radiobacillus deserti]QDP41271.1 flagellar hook protein FliD [Radiobacillus deserti]
MSSNLRIGGLASGMDIDSLVNDLMKAERLPLQKMEQDRTWLTWQRDAYRDVSSLFLELDQLTFDMKLSSAYNTKNVSSSNETYLSATASATAANGVHTISNVNVATAAYNISYLDDPTKGISGTTKIDPTKSIWSQKNNFGDASMADVAAGGIWKKKTFTNSDIAVTTEGASFKLQKGALDEAFLSGKTIEVVDAQNTSKQYNIVTDPSATLGTGDVFVNTGTGEIKFGENLAKGSTIKGQDYEHYTVSFSITTYDEKGNPINDSTNTDGDFDFEFNGNTSLNQIMTEISNSNAGVSAFYDTASDKVSFQRKNTGNLNEAGVEMAFSGAFLTGALGMDSLKEQKGTDASFTIDGLATTRKSNTFDINGVSITLKDNMPAGTNVTVSVQNDTEAAYDNIKKFVDKYNEVIEKLNGMVSEEKYRDYKPLTDEQKEDMSDKEIELWEEKAKSGLLRNDSIVESTLSDMRRAWYSEVSTGDVYSHLTAVGIETSSSYLENGKLVINESKLKSALSEDPEAVQKLFSNTSTDDSRGLINRLEDVLQKSVDRIEEKAGKSTSTLQQYTMGKRLDDLNDRIYRFEDRLIQVENRYWSQFSAMEAAINRMNQQSAYLMSQFAG